MAAYPDKQFYYDGNSLKLYPPIKETYIGVNENKFTITYYNINDIENDRLAKANEKLKKEIELLRKMLAGRIA